MAQCQMCGNQTHNKRRKLDGNLRLCDDCRASVLASRQRQAEWEAQTGNPNFQARHGYKETYTLTG